MDQLNLPMELEEGIPDNHLVRLVNAAVNRLDDKIFAAAYPGGGRDSYHPKMLTKVIVYAYTNAIILLAKSLKPFVKMLCSCGLQADSVPTSVLSIASVPIDDHSYYFSYPHG